MRLRRSRTAAAGLLLMAAAGWGLAAHGQEQLPDRRAVGKQSAKPGTDASVRDSLLDLLQQLESLQSEVRQLRNTVEVQGHELEQLQGRQRSLYDDLDRRLRDAERRNAAAPAAPTAVPGAAAGNAPSAPISAAAPAPAPRVTTPAQQQQYDAAFGLMKQGLYEKAVKAFRDFLAKNPGSGLADNAQYWIAEGNYVLRNYKLALEEYTKVLSYPQGSKIPDAMLKIGYVYYELGTYDKARKALADVQTQYPGTSVARLAATRLEKMQKEGH